MQQKENTQEIVEEFHFHFKPCVKIDYEDYIELDIFVNEKQVEKYRIKTTKDKYNYGELAEVLFLHTNNGEAIWKDVTKERKRISNIVNHFVWKQKDLLNESLPLSVTFTNIINTVIIDEFFGYGINFQYKFNKINIKQCVFNWYLRLNNVNANKLTINSSRINISNLAPRHFRSDLYIENCNIKNLEVMYCEIDYAEISSCKIENLNCNHLDNKHISIIYCDLLKNVSFTDSLTQFLHIKNNKNTETISLLHLGVGNLDVVNNKASKDIELTGVMLWGYMNFAGSRFVNKDGESNLYISHLLLVDKVDSLNELNRKSVVILNAAQYFKNIELAIAKNKNNRFLNYSFGLTHSVFNTLQTIREAIKQSAPDLNNNLRYVQTRLKKNIIDNNLKEVFKNKDTTKAYKNIENTVVFIKNIAKFVIKIISIAINGITYFYTSKNKKDIIKKHSKNLLEGSLALFTSQSTTYSLRESKIALWFNIITGGGVFYLKPAVLFFVSFAILKGYFGLDIVLPFFIFTKEGTVFTDFSAWKSLLTLTVNAWLYFLAWQAIKAFTKAKGVR